MEGVRNVLLASIKDIMEDMEETEYFLNSEKFKNLHIGSL
jgi:hypothetical protein